MKHHTSDLESPRGLWECLVSFLAAPESVLTCFSFRSCSRLCPDACNVCMEQCVYISEHLCVFAVGTDTENEDNCVEFTSAEHTCLSVVCFLSSR